MEGKEVSVKILERKIKHLGGVLDDTYNHSHDQFVHGLMLEAIREIHLILEKMEIPE